MLIAELLLGCLNAFHVAGLDGGQNRSGLEKGPDERSRKTQSHHQMHTLGAEGQELSQLVRGMRSLENLENQKMEVGEVNWYCKYQW
jgi:hypothetical protein